MVVEDAGAGVEIVGFAVVCYFPVGGGLGDAVGAAGPEGGGFVGGDRPGIAKAFTGSGVVEAHGLFGEADGFEEIEGAGGDAFEGFDGLLKGEADGALACEVVEFVGLDFGQDLEDAAEVVEGHGFELNSIANAEALKVAECGHLAIAGGAMDLVAFVEEQAGEVGSVLAGDAADEGGFLGTISMKEGSANGAVWYGGCHRSLFSWGAIGFSLGCPGESGSKGRGE